MDLTAMLQDIKSLEESVVYDKAILKTAEETNAKQLKIEEKYEKCKEVREELKEYTNKLKTLFAVVNKKASDFTQNRKSLIEQTVEENLKYIFPEENFKVKLNLDLSKTGRETCQLLLGKGDSNAGIVYTPTTAQNGRFVRQLISLVVVYTINMLRGSDMLYMDEALASSDKHNLTKLKPLLDRIKKSKMQVILIEHKAELYEGVDRRQFILHKNRLSGETKIVSQEDIRRSEDESEN